MTRLEQAQIILETAVQSKVSCPFMNAMPIETRAELHQEFPNPHQLPETQLLEIAAQHDYFKESL